MKQCWAIRMLLIAMGILLIVGCFGVYFFTVGEDEATGGKRLPKMESVFKNLRIATDLTPGESTITIESGWYERERAGLFIIGGLRRLVLDRVTITTSTEGVIDSVPSCLVDLLSNTADLAPFNLAELRRLELKKTKDQGGFPFLRVPIVEIPVNTAQPILLQNAWFREQEGRWEQLQYAQFERMQGRRAVLLKMTRQNGTTMTLPLGFGF